MARIERTPEPTPSRHSPASPSDKENQENSTSSKRKSQIHNMSSSRNSAKRQRLGNKTSNNQTASQPLTQQQRRKSTKYYDPDQDPAERRRIRKGLRDLNRDLNDSRSEYLQAGNTGLKETFEKADEIFRNVKQTSDATIDSRLLVNAADLSHKKTATLVLGETSAKIDVDEFVSKCISFMRAGPEYPYASISSTQRRRAPRRTQADLDDSDDENGDGMNWDWLGRAACFRHSARPAASGFLLGPLSVQKRTRQITQRRVRERIDPSQAVRPQELRKEDLDKQETSNLTAMCSSINKLLGKTQDRAESAVEKILGEMQDPAPKVVEEIMAKHQIADDAGVPLFNFCINPKSFGQSVENLFYLSFLVRDGTVGIGTDSRGVPTLHPSKPWAPSEAQRQGVQKHQSVFSLDFDMWTALINTFNIKECIIPHREEEEHNTVRGCKVRMSSGSIAVFSPVNLTPAVRETISSLGGRVKYIAALDLEHHIHLTPWEKAFPDAEIIAPEGLSEKRQSVPEYKDTPIQHILRQQDAAKDNGKEWLISEEFNKEFDVEFVHGHVNKELVFLHKPSLTLIEADLLFNLPAREQYSKTGEDANSGILTKIMRPLLSTQPPATWQKRIVWYLFSSADRKAFGESMKRIDKWEFNRLIPCHGDVIESGAKGVFRSVFEWFL
ncbi:putative nuclear protein Qri2/Nse4 [Aspergillus undulatus]|uniref:putative nuclear protein Qri2/Nse4 n=1 Tax=Aspergillus undulatus TaxID=1810928 RepID=UPI003CCD7247